VSGHPLRPVVARLVAKGEDAVLALLGVLLVIAVIAIPALLWVKAPCELWTFSRAGDMPARCLVR
jgi:hypothetical protein